MGWGWTAAVHTEDRDKLIDSWRHLLAYGKADEIEARPRRYDGDYRWFLIRVEPVRDNHGNIFKWYGPNTTAKELYDKMLARYPEWQSRRSLELGHCDKEMTNDHNNSFEDVRETPSVNQVRGLSAIR